MDAFLSWLRGYGIGRGMETPEGLLIRTTDPAVEDLCRRYGDESFRHHRRQIPRVNIHRPGIRYRRVLDQYEILVTGAGLPPLHEVRRVAAACRDTEAHFWRGVTESCGTLCFRKKKKCPGLAFSHSAAQRIGQLRGMLDDAGWRTGPIAFSRAGNSWFDLADADVPAFGEWIYREKGDIWSPARYERYRKGIRQMEKLKSPSAPALSTSL